MGTFQPSKRRSQPTSQTQPQTQPSTATNSRLPAVSPASRHLPRNPLFPYTPRTASKAPVSAAGSPPRLRSAPGPTQTPTAIRRTPTVNSPALSTPGFTAADRSIAKPDTFRRPRTPHNILPLDKLDKLFNFLVENRRGEADKFAQGCWTLYNEKYSKKRQQKAAPQPPQQNAHLSTPSNTSLSNQHPSKSPTGDQTAKPSEAPLQHAPHPEPPPVICLDNDPPAAVANNSQQRRNPHSPDQTRASATPSDPSASDQTRTDHPSDASPNDSRVSVHPLFARQSRLERKALNRWNRFTSTQHPTSTDPSHYHIWQPLQPNAAPVLLDSDVCRPALLDNHGKLSDIHLEALRFLWFHLVENTCTGAVFSHTIGYPRTHIIYLFALLFAQKRTKSKLLVLCPDASLYEWQQAQESFGDRPIIRVLRNTSWVEDIRDWREHGGVLLASDEAYFSVLTKPSSPAKEAALAALITPGPDICIVDEASRLSMLPEQPTSRTMLYRTHTTARLALTSQSLVGFITRAWPVLDWACPQLFGTRSDFWRTYVRAIAHGHKVDSTTEDGARALEAARKLHAKMSMVTFTVEPSMRRASLHAKGLTFQESTIVVNLSPEEIEMYRESEAFLSAAVARGEISPFLALQLLICAASSSHAFIETLHRLATASDAFLGNAGKLEEFTRVRITFDELLTIVRPMLKKDMMCSKMQLALYIARWCIQSGERLVMFTSSPELQKELFRFLNSNLDGKRVHTFDHIVDLGERSKALKDFNTEREGAILVAPYGPTLQCMESSGWGFVNATRVLVVDTTWHISPCVEAINRVHNFAQQNSVVHVHFLFAEDTIEASLASETESKYVLLKRSSTSSFQDQVGDDSSARGFLIQPEISAAWLSRRKAPAVTRNRAAIVERRPAMLTDREQSEVHEGPVMLITKVVMSDEESCVQRLVLGSNRYKALSEVLTAFMRNAPKVNSKDVFDASICTEQSDAVQSLRESLHVLGGPELLSFKQRGTIGPLLSHDGFYLEHRHAFCHLLASWDSYFRLYESEAPHIFARPVESTFGRKRPRSDASDLADEVDRRRYRLDSQTERSGIR